MTNYYKDVDFDPKNEDWEQWIDSLGEPMKSDFKAKGFEQTKGNLNFRRFYLESNDIEMRDYLREKLTKDQFAYYMEQAEKNREPGDHLEL